MVAELSSDPPRLHYSFDYDAIALAEEIEIILKKI
jgi:hypothetical protein